MNNDEFPEELRMNSVALETAIPEKEAFLLLDLLRVHPLAK